MRPCALVRNAILPALRPSCSHQRVFICYDPRISRLAALLQAVKQTLQSESSSLSAFRRLLASARIRRARAQRAKYLFLDNFEVIFGPMSPKTHVSLKIRFIGAIIFLKTE